MKQITLLFIGLYASLAFGQFDGNTSPDYPTLIKIYQDLAARHNEIELYQMGDSDFGLPIYLCVINGAQDSLKTFERAQRETTVLINNAIHPGEPDGVNACLIWINNWISNGKKLGDIPVIGIIPAYNVGGMMNRSGTSRANQNGPEEYGFRGNAQNLDLNRDFIKMDSKNMFTFARIYQGLDPDVFVDTHVSNGADYQYTMTYIASVRERMPPSLGDLLHDEMIPYLHAYSAKRQFDLIPYVHLKGETPETGIQVFNDLPRYAMGYASLFNALSFTSETHMLKPFPQRVQSTLVFLEGCIDWTAAHREAIEEARNRAVVHDMERTDYAYNYTLTDKKDSIRFLGYEYSKPESNVTGGARLKYHEDQPFDKYVPYYQTYESNDHSPVPAYFVVGRQCSDIIERLLANDIEIYPLETDTTVEVYQFQVDYFENGNKPYEGHYLHNKVKYNQRKNTVKLKAGDWVVPMDQVHTRFIMSVLLPDSPDSYFAWNFFDSYVQQKEYFSPYVFEDKAEEILKNNPKLKADFDAKVAADKEFSESTWDQLYYIYQHSEYYEPTHNVLPIFRSIMDR